MDDIYNKDDSYYIALNPSKKYLINQQTSKSYQSCVANQELNLLFLPKSQLYLLDLS